MTAEPLTDLATDYHLDLLATGVVLLDANLHIQALNLSAENLLEVSAGRALGSTLDGLQAARALQVDNQSVAIRAVRARREAARPHVLVEIEHNAQFAVGLDTRAHRLDRSCRIRQVGSQ